MATEFPRCKRGLAVAVVACVGLVSPGGGAAAQPEAGNDAASLRRALGEKLFGELLFTNPGADFSASCAGCHFLGRQSTEREERLYSDSVPLSLTASKTTTLRNTPGLVGVAAAPLLNRDGSYRSLEALIQAKLVGPELGWSPQDRERAFAAIHFVLENEGESDASPSSYAQDFAAAYGVDLAAMGRDEVVQMAVRALADFIRGLESTHTSPWDAFVSMNRLRPGPIADEDPKRYAGEILYSRIGNQEGRLLVKRPQAFSRAAYEGFKTFFRTAGESAGNCVVCHPPPEFTDLQFHNTGIAQAEYDEVHGAGAFSRLAIPTSAATRRPVAHFLARPSRAEPGRADLGHWNYADAATSPQRRDDEREEAFLSRMVGAFRTPTLRNLRHTDPYMHNGAYPTLRDAVSEIVRLNGLARAGKLRQIDEEYREMNLSQDDVEPLVAFLGVLDDVGRDDFRQYLIHLADD